MSKGIKERIDSRTKVRYYEKKEQADFKRKEMKILEM